ncbi:cation-translocating P-type ATPase [Desulfopila sp. IMCC35008]|uniref:cation-translocating P-type ATPase n=1 Tax=Desulfopila sp. IMCC35008 TaxID=2653858 RepID=UPI0013CFB262|nr:cation-translocating P-type ATPase [Desulfopila sp. IMCC35008]
MISDCTQSVDEIFNRLNSSRAGLSSPEAERRQAANGLNRLAIQPPTPAWKILLNQFNNAIIYLLLFAVLFSLIIGEYGDSTVILIILIMNGCIGFYQEFKANRSLEALKNMMKQSARVKRDGVISLLNAEELVCGDIIQLETGDKVAADCRLIESMGISAEESVLTGESEPVPKQVETLSHPAMIAEQTNMLFSSTSIAAGRGLAIVTACGMQTEIGRITELVAGVEKEMTPLQVRLDRFGRNLSIAIIIICVLVFCLSAGRKWLLAGGLASDAFLEFAFIAISLAVAAVPTALPAVVTIALSIGTGKLLKKNVLVRRLTSVETLGCCDVICSDKTGTLTKNRMTVKTAWTPNQELDLDEDDIRAKVKKNPDISLLLRIAGVCNNSTLTEHGTTTGGNPTETALLEAAETAGVDYQAKRLSELPFDPQRKCMSVVIEEGNETVLYTKGAPDNLLNRCTRIVCNGSVQVMTSSCREQIKDAIHRLSSRAMRTMGFACREHEGHNGDTETNLAFVGLLAMADPPRDDVAESVRRAGEAGVRVIMITGDHRETAIAIGNQIGIHGKAVTGSELDHMDESELAHALTETAIFARVVPEHKQQIVHALKTHGHRVAMTGDGVNDAPALKGADIGIAVGSGTDVARESSDFVLLDDSFTSIVDAVEEGRGIYENIQKSIMLLLSGNLMEVLIIFLAVLLGFNLPLTALLLLWINLITDGAPALAYSIDPYGKGIMKRPPLSPEEGLLPRHRLRLLIGSGVSGALIGLALFHFSGGNSGQGMVLERAQTMVFNYVVLYEMILVFVIRGNYDVPLCTNGLLWLSVIFSILIQGVIMYTPLCTVFHVTPLDIVALSQVTAAAAIFFCVAFIFRNYVSGRKQQPA